MKSNRIPLPKDGQLAKVKELIEATIRKSGIGKGRLQKVLERGDGLQYRFEVALLDLGKLHDDESVVNKMHHFYPKGWRMPDLETQANEMGNIFPGLHILNLASAFIPNIPENFDGLTLLPKVSSLGKVFGVKNPYADGYQVLVSMVLKLLAQRGLLLPEYAEEFGDTPVNLEPRVASKLKRLEAATDSDYMVLATSTGNFFGGWDFGDARSTALLLNLLPIGSVHAGCILLMMPDRLRKIGDLMLGCLGDIMEDISTYCPTFKVSYFTDNPSSKTGVAYKLLDSCISGTHGWVVASTGEEYRGTVTMAEVLQRKRESCSI